MKIFCLFKKMYLTIRHWINGGIAVIDGHSYDDFKKRKYLIGKDIVVCKEPCSVCNEVSVVNLKRADYEIMKKMGAL